jgi:hypothetical protein
MKGSVSDHSICAVASAASIPVLWMIFAVPMVGVVPVGLLALLTLATVLLLGTRFNRSMAHVTRLVESGPKAGLGSKGARP